MTVGWLMSEADAEVLVVVPHIADGRHVGGKRQGCGDMAIPRRAVVSVRELS